VPTIEDTVIVHGANMVASIPQVAKPVHPGRHRSSQLLPVSASRKRGIFTTRRYIPRSVRERGNIIHFHAMIDCSDIIDLVHALESVLVESAHHGPKTPHDSLGHEKAKNEPGEV